MRPSFFAAAAFAVALGAFSATQAAEVHVAVVANFTGPMQKILPGFEAATGHKAVVSYGTVGKFYAQVKNGAPFEVLVSADEATPARLEQDGLASPKSRFTYAIGKLMLWSAKPGLVDDKGEVLKTGDFKHLAISNPKVTVYGAAAVEVLKNLGLMEKLERRFVVGENITQAHQFVATGNADLGFVALSQIFMDGKYADGSYWEVPSALYPTIKQDAVILSRGKDSPAAAALMEYLKTDSVKEIIKSFGYIL